MTQTTNADDLPPELVELLATLPRRVDEKSASR